MCVWAKRTITASSCFWKIQSVAWRKLKQHPRDSESTRANLILIFVTLTDSAHGDTHSVCWIKGINTEYPRQAVLGVLLPFFHRSYLLLSFYLCSWNVPFHGCLASGFISSIWRVHRMVFHYNTYFMSCKSPWRKNSWKPTGMYVFKLPSETSALRTTPPFALLSRAQPLGVFKPWTFCGLCMEVTRPWNHSPEACHGIRAWITKEYYG